jgi:hypothetical protein
MTDAGDFKESDLAFPARGHSEAFSGGNLHAAPQTQPLDIAPGW